MTADQLDRHLQNGDSPVVLDVRSAFEYAAGHIPGAIHAPLPEVTRAAKAAVKSKEDLLVIVCEHGPRAQLAKMFLHLRGYRNLQLLEGHMSRWRSSGRSMSSA